jgi:osmotically-inducible protein OsmY
MGQRNYGPDWERGMGQGYGSNDRYRGQTSSSEYGYGERGRGQQDWQSSNYGSSSSQSGGYGSGSQSGQQYGRGGGQQDWQQSRYSGSSGSGQGSYGYEPTGWSYTEIWMIPGPHTGRGPQGYKRSDERIKEDVNERLMQHGQLDAGNINVQVKDGEVTLTGTVNNRRDKYMAEQAIESCMGVKDVQNQLRVQQDTGTSEYSYGSTGQSSMSGSSNAGRTGTSSTQSGSTAQKDKSTT